jgi:DNA-binding NtrC family response regulator
MPMPIASTPSRTKPSKARLLFVDDEHRVLNSMNASFRRNYQVFLANSGREALEILDRESIDVVISDQRMPEMTGVEVLTEVKARAPDTMRILLTGYADVKAIEASINESEVFRYLMKPCPPIELKNTIALAVEAAASSRADKEQPAGSAAQLIRFPNSDANRRPPAVDPGRPAEFSNPRAAEAAGPGGATPVPDAYPRAQQDEAAVQQRGGTTDDVEILVLTADKSLFTSVEAAVQDGRPVHRARTIGNAIGILAEHPIGVMVTDTAVDEKGIASLTNQLKHLVPELVTIIASDRSDANSLINLINQGQVFRFLLKPVPQGQCRLSLNSAVEKFSEMTLSHAAIARHRVDVTETTGETVESRMLTALMSTIARLRARLRGE